MSTAPALSTTDLRRTYGKGAARVVALDDVSIDLPPGTFTALMGPSGSGKSTFLQCASGLDRPDSGSVRLGDQELTGMSETRLTKLRRRHVGFVFQSYNLLPALTVRQNIELPARLGGYRLDPAWTQEVAERTAIAPLMRRRPAQISGGQQQRVAIARALVCRPDVLFADEPTGALDTKTGQAVLELLQQCVHQLGQTVLMVTHDNDAAACADRVLFLRDARLVGELTAPTPSGIAREIGALT